MSTELLTPEAVETATLKLDDDSPSFNHPIVQFVRTQGLEMKRIHRGYQASSNKRKEGFARRNYVSLALKMGRVRDFSLNPLDLVAIWAHSEQYNVHFQLFSPVLALSYAGRRFKEIGYHQDDPIDLNWYAAIPYRYLNDRGLPEYVTRSREGLVHMQGRLKSLEANLGVLNTYAGQYGTTPLLDSLQRSFGPTVVNLGGEIAQILVDKHGGYQLPHEAPL